jgi:integrase/recombinase XerD
MSFHSYDKVYASALGTLERSTISDKNKQLIKEFVNDLMLENIGKPRLAKYLKNCLKIAQRLDKDFDKATKPDVKELIGQIQQADYTAWTKRDHRIIVRRFFRWLHKDPNAEIVDFVKVGIKRSEMNLPSEGDLLTPEDIQKIMEAARHPRDKALISTIWESGARIGEIGNLKIKHVVFDSNGVVLSVKGKTGSRKIRLICSTPLLSTWLNMHPYKDDPNSPVWVHLRKQKNSDQLGYNSVRLLLIKLFFKAGIKKKCNPHLFRHSRATFMARHLTEFQMNQYFGWIQGSDMPATYVHMSGKDVDNAILAMNGMKVQEEKSFQEKPKICSRCDTINLISSKHCNKCGGALDIQIALQHDELAKKRSQADNVMAMLMEDDQIQALIAQKLQQMKTKSVSAQRNIVG